MTLSYSIKTDVFEGPLPLLLSLIEKRKLLINDISLAKVADDFINHMKTLADFEREEVANFILVASTLILIKSRSLLPNLEITEEEKGNIDDLEARLRMYKIAKDLGIIVKGRFGQNISLFPSGRKIIEPVFTPSKDSSLSNLLNAIKNVIYELPKKEFVSEAIVKKMISIEEMMDNLLKRITSGLKMSFKDFVGDKKDKVDIIVGFLAMLELVKQGAIEATQADNSDDIAMEPKDLAVPQYN